MQGLDQIEDAFEETSFMSPGFGNDSMVVGPPPHYSQQQQSTEKQAPPQSPLEPSPSKYKTSKRNNDVTQQKTVQQLNNPAPFDLPPLVNNSQHHPMNFDLHNLNAEMEPTVSSPPKPPPLLNSKSKVGSPGARNHQ
jgi:hypothetical protein